eukprot:TRINITY_DN13593_c0_g1_i1.p1 TRINITY_DN13593_c0_g1~~TRINITY_DN13593_c0_g1_i1.p1  ORF type:complete len:198 (-),score=6.82 TRINITY_DN13593_c0_g1_i1:287-880(-)
MPPVSRFLLMLLFCWSRKPTCGYRVKLQQGQQSLSEFRHPRYYIRSKSHRQHYLCDLGDAGIGFSDTCEETSRLFYSDNGGGYGLKDIFNHARTHYLAVRTKTDDDWQDCYHFEFRRNGISIMNTGWDRADFTANKHSDGVYDLKYSTDPYDFFLTYCDQGQAKVCKEIPCSWQAWWWYGCDHDRQDQRVVLHEYQG